MMDDLGRYVSGHGFRESVVTAVADGRQGSHLVRMTKAPTKGSMPVPPTFLFVR